MGLHFVVQYVSLEDEERIGFLVLTDYAVYDRQEQSVKDLFILVCVFVLHSREVLQTVALKVFTVFLMCLCYVCQVESVLIASKSFFYLKDKVNDVLQD